MATERVQLPLLFFCIPSPKLDLFAAGRVQNTNAQLREWMGPKSGLCFWLQNTKAPLLQQEPIAGSTPPVSPGGVTWRCHLEVNPEVTICHWRRWKDCPEQEPHPHHSSPLHVAQQHKELFPLSAPIYAISQPRLRFGFFWSWLAMNAHQAPRSKGWQHFYPTRANQFFIYGTLYLQTINQCLFTFKLSFHTEGSRNKFPGKSHKSTYWERETVKWSRFFFRIVLWSEFTVCLSLRNTKVFLSLRQKIHTLYLVYIL